MDWLDQSQLSKIESGDREFDVFELLDLAHVYRTTILDLLGPLTPAERNEVDRIAKAMAETPPAEGRKRVKPRTEIRV